MTRTLFNVEPLLPLLDDGALVLTPNNRLRNNMRLAYCNYRDNGGSDSQVFEYPRIMSLKEWQSDLWRKLQQSGHEPAFKTIASNTVCDQLWQQVIAEAGLEKTGVHSAIERRALANQARIAHDTLIQWLCPTQSHDYDPELSAWITSFEAKLKQHDMITEAMSLQIIIEAFNNNVISKENAVYLHSFVDISPLSQTLLTAATSNVSELISDNLKSHSLCKTFAEDQANEIKAAANWAWEILQDNPNATIGIIAPQLARDRELIERQFCNVFESHTYNPSQARTALPFNISAAQSLSTTQLIASTLQLLDLNKHQLSLEQAITLLTNPFYGDTEKEHSLRAFITHNLKSQESFTCTTSDITHFANLYCQQLEVNVEDDESTRLNACQAWAKNLFSFIEIRRRNKQALLPSEWTEVFIQQLNCIGWPGNRRIDSVEFQQLKQWHALLEDFAALDSVGIKLKIDDALANLKTIAQSTPFQTETRDTPIHIVGAFESVGLQFSHTWVLGLNDKEWPASLSPNPLLPKQLQFSKKMPKASLEREIEIAQTLTQFFIQTAPHCVISYSRQQGHLTVNESPLIRDLEWKDIGSLSTTNVGLPKIEESATNQGAWEWVDCESGPTLVSSEDNPTRGGQTFFKLQAECPFNAFAQMRLRAKPIATPSLGLTPADKGNALHNALEIIWRKLGTQKNLIELTEKQLNALINGAVDKYFTQLKRKDAKSLGNLYYELEKQRMISLLASWLEMEKQRPPFSIVAVEESLKTAFMGIHLNMRIDRIDHLESGEIILFDYKTSARTSAAWLKERPIEPQLPLYALCYPLANGISFAVIENQNLGFNGIAENADELSISGIQSTAKIKFESWEQLKHQFEANLGKLAEEILAGDARVTFQNGQYQQDRDRFASLNRYAEHDFIQYLWNQNQ